MNRNITGKGRLLAYQTPRNGGDRGSWGKLVQLERDRNEKPFAYQNHGHNLDANALLPEDTVFLEHLRRVAYEGSERCQYQHGAASSSASSPQSSSHSSEFRVVTFLDAAYFPVFKNWLLYYVNVCGLQQLQPQRLEIVCMDTPSHDLLRTLRLTCSPNSIDRRRHTSSWSTENLRPTKPAAREGSFQSSKSSSTASPSPKKTGLWLQRMRILHHLIIHLGYSVLLVDVDALWLQDPFPSLFPHLLGGTTVSEFDVVASRGRWPETISQQWGATLCMGLVFFRSNRFTHSLLNATLNTMLHAMHPTETTPPHQTLPPSSVTSQDLSNMLVDDQQAINQVLCSLQMKWRRSTFSTDSFAHTNDSSASSAVVDVLKGVDTRMYEKQKINREQQFSRSNHLRVNSKVEKSEELPYRLEVDGNIYYDIGSVSAMVGSVSPSPTKKKASSFAALGMLLSSPSGSAESTSVERRSHSNRNTLNDHKTGRILLLPHAFYQRHCFSAEELSSASIYGNRSQVDALRSRVQSLLLTETNETTSGITRVHHAHALGASRNKSTDKAVEGRGLGVKVLHCLGGMSTGQNAAQKIRFLQELGLWRL